MINRKLLSTVATPFATCLLVIGIFLSQSFFVPIFVYSFLSILSALFLITRGRKIRSLDFKNVKQWRGIILFSVLVLAAIGTVRVASLIYFLTSLACAPLVMRIIEIDPKIKMRSAQWYIILCAISFLIGGIWFFTTNSLEGMFLLDGSGQNLRFRGFNLEPSFIGFSLSTAYIFVLFDPDGMFARRRGLRVWLLVLVWVMVVLTLSPFAIVMTTVVSFPFLLRSIGGRMVCILALGGLVMIAAYSDRGASIVSGDDNSGNFRTWGSIMIALQQIENCGPLGCGIGSSRSVLADEPLMITFAATEALMLPNLLASATVEGGYPLLTFVVLAIVFAAFPTRHASQSYGMSVAVFMLLLSFAASGSYLADAHFWAITGFLASAVRSTGPRCLPHRSNMVSKI